jgi:AcrR family transcriptional regulator
MFADRLMRYRSLRVRAAAETPVGGGALSDQDESEPTQSGRPALHDEKEGHTTTPSALAELPPTARRLLEAARRLLERSGYRALTLEAVAREAGEYKSLIWYHFGGKDGLVVALADWVLYDALHQQRIDVDTLPPGPRRRQAVWADTLAVASDSDQRLFFDLLPHLLKNEKTRRRLHALYVQYRTMVAEGISLSSEASAEERTLAAMQIGLSDGLAIQLLADPDSVDMERVGEIWQALVSAVLGDAERPASPA